MTSSVSDRADTLAERLFGATIGALELYSIYLGAELGLYRTLAQHGALTSGELAERAGIAPRYAREWLEQQAVAGLLDVAHAGTSADAHRFSLHPDHARVLSDADDPAHVAPFAHMLAGIGGRVRFLRADASVLDRHGPYDLVLILEALHDMADPVSALAAARRALARGGAVLVVDERVAETFTAPGDEVERMMYGWSVTHCLPTQLADHPSAALGTVLRADTMRNLATEAGFSQVDVLDVENDFFRLYRLDL